MNTYLLTIAYRTTTHCLHVLARSHEEAFNQAIEILAIDYDELDAPVIIVPCQKEKLN